MKTITIKFISLSVVLLVFLTFQNCGDSEGPAPPNKAPTVSITSPGNNSNAALGATVTISVSASDTDGSVSSVKISIDNSNVATLQSSPYTYDWDTQGASAGAHDISVTATDDDGATSNTKITINLTADTPIVSTTDITEITGTTAKSGGNVTDDGGSAVTARGVVWAESSGPTTDSYAGKSSDGTGTGTFTSNLANLKAATTYYVKAYATNAAGTSYGSEVSFTTAGLPVVTTNATVSERTSSSAKAGGEVTDNGGSSVTARGMVWSKTNANVTLDDADGSTTEGSGTGSFTSVMTPLDRYTIYYFRAYATNGAGTGYGDPFQFNTLAEAPTMSTHAVTTVLSHLARCGGEVVDNGGDPNVLTGLVWATYQNPTYNVNEGIYSSNGNIPFDTVMTGLQPGTTYYVRSWGYNSTGVEKGYGAEKSFTTPAFSVTTGSFTDARDNTVYSTVTIEDQTWMAENLAYLPQVCAPDGNCGYWVYDYTGTDVTAAKATSNYSTYRVLYNYDMATAACPQGWHLPSDIEWSYLEVYLGMKLEATVGSDLRGTNQGGKMKEVGTTHWQNPNTGATNISGFTALPGGFNDYTSKTFQALGTSGFFWSSTAEGNWVNYRYLINTSEQIGSDWISTALGNDKKAGGSVRCIKD